MCACACVADCFYYFNEYVLCVRDREKERERERERERNLMRNARHFSRYCVLKSILKRFLTEKSCGMN